MGVFLIFVFLGSGLRILAQNVPHYFGVVFFAGIVQEVVVDHANGLRIFDVVIDLHQVEAVLRAVIQQQGQHAVLDADRLVLLTRTAVPHHVTLIFIYKLCACRSIGFDKLYKVIDWPCTPKITRNS